MPQTNITFWDIQPRTGKMPLTVTVDGFLFRNGIEENQADSIIVDGETVYLQQNIGGQWQNIRTFTTRYDSSRGYHGHIFGTHVFPIGYTQGAIRTRLTYNGNTAKTLTGCGEED